MHMANELLSPGVAVGTIAIAAGAVGFICHRAKRFITSDKFALMGIMGAFVFAAQMVQFSLPFLPGTSGHLIGAVLLAIMLGPIPASIVLSSVIIVQCLIFQDGGLLALGCNIINMAIVPCFLGCCVYNIGAPRHSGKTRTYISSVIACVLALVTGAVLVTLETALSGILIVPLVTFMATMVGVHIIIGFAEGLITAAVLLYLRQVHPLTFAESRIESPASGKRALYATFLIASLVIGAGLSLLASEKPDGLEWSYAERPDQPTFEAIISNDSLVIAAVDKVQSKLSPLPDYTIRTEASEATTGESSTHAGMGWTSFAAVAGSAITMLLVWLAGWAIRKRNGVDNAPYPN